MSNNGSGSGSGLFYPGRIVSDSRIKQFEAFLAAKGQRLTRERRIIADLVFSMEGPLDAGGTADVVIERLSSRRVSRAVESVALQCVEYFTFSNNQVWSG